MVSNSPQLSRLRHLVVLMAVLMCLGGAALLVLGIIQLVREQVFAWPGLWLVITGGIIILTTLFILSIVILLLKLETTARRHHDRLLDIHDAISAHGKQLALISKFSEISDAAKAVISRDRELEEIRLAVREDMRREDWEGAFFLAGEMERRFGFREEVSQIRQEIQSVHSAKIEEKIGAAIARIEGLIDRRDWSAAASEIGRLTKAAPDDPRVNTLFQDLSDHREEYKQQLLKRWNAALEKDDIDGGIKLLAELDRYLTQDEAKSLESKAREMFNEKLHQLGIQFRFAVKEQRWNDALEIAVQIVEDYPNSRMAKEVQELESALRKRAGLSGDVDVVSTVSGTKSN
jgi:hypothetical protein